MVGWHPQLNGHAFKQTPGDSEGWGSPVCCSPWGQKESDTLRNVRNQLINFESNNATRSYTQIRSQLYFSHLLSDEFFIYSLFCI